MIIETLFLRLKRVWCCYLYLHDQAEKDGLVSPSTAPCSPAPGRRFLIVRNDVQAAPGGLFLSFDGILSSSFATQATAYERHSSLESLSQVTASQLGLALDDSARGNPPGRKRWGLLKHIMPFAGSSGDRSKLQPLTSKSPPLSGNDIAGSNLQIHVDQSKDLKSDDGKPHTQQVGPEASISKPAQITPAFRSHSFKFSLEWTDRESSPAGKERQLYPPRLPLQAQMLLQSPCPVEYLYEPLKPEGLAVGPSKYAGRALAEWAILVMECQKFFERRKVEGVPDNHKVETPTLGVEPFRRSN